MKLQLKRFDKTIPLPAYKTANAVGFDLSSRQDITIAPHAIGYIPLNIALKVPAGFWTMLTARSSTHKLGLIPANGVGIIDPDYCGDNDELLFAAYNFTDLAVTIPRSTRVAQLVVLPVNQFDLTEVDRLTAADRGGFGTTGLN